MSFQRVLASIPRNPMCAVVMVIAQVMIRVNVKKIIMAVCVM